MQINLSGTGIQQPIALYMGTGRLDPERQGHQENQKQRKQRMQYYRTGISPVYVAKPCLLARRFAREVILMGVLITGLLIVCYQASGGIILGCVIDPYCGGADAEKARRGFMKINIMFA